jgi:hypothetical protein
VVGGRDPFHLYDVIRDPRQGQAGLSFKGFLNALAEGEYTSWLQCDTGAELWLHEAHVLNDDFAHNGNEVQASMCLAVGEAFQLEVVSDKFGEDEGAEIPVAHG